MKNLARIYQALGEVTRLRIMKLLEQEERCVCDLAAALDMSQPKVSFHLAALKDAGLIMDRKEGRWTHYRIDDTDLFRRFIILSSLQRIAEDSVADDRMRLVEFLRTKKGLACETDKVVITEAGYPRNVQKCCAKKTGFTQEAA